MWQASNDKITWVNMPDKASAMGHRYVREMLDGLPPPIPEPAPELCAFPGCGRLKLGWHHSPGIRGTGCLEPCGTPHERCHDFVAPQAKSVMSPAQQQIAEAVKAANQQAKPVLREPKPGADGYPDVCLECRGEKGRCLWVCDECAQTVDIGAHEIAWNRRQAKPAAKDIPSRLAAAARALDRKIDTNETGPSAVAAAPAIEPWRPTVDDWDLLPDAETGWRR